MLPGGDTVQIAKTRASLEDIGVTVDVRSPGGLDNLPGYDLAHIFNIQTPESAWEVFQALKKRGLPVVLSPIYWEMFEYWFELASHDVIRWKLISSILGSRLAQHLYLQWQHKKARLNAQWQLQRHLLDEACRILPNSHSEAIHLHEVYNLDDSFLKKVDVVPNAIDTNLYASLPEPNESFVKQYGIRDFILEVGMLYPVKNQLGVIEALFDLPVPLVFIGQVMPAMAGYADLCHTRALERGNVHFIERISHEELPGIYALASIHILPSWRETPGLVSLEAAATNCRIVTTSIGSARDYFGDFAWYCYPGDRDSIRRAVDEAMKQPKSNVLRERILLNYTWQRTAEETRRSYEKVLT